MSDQTTVDPTRHMTRSIALVFCCLILSITGYCTTEILMNPDRCTKDVADITENCIIRADGDKVLLQPGSKAPPDLKDAIRANKAEVIALLTEPLYQPPRTEQELRRLVDYLADPKHFSRWLENLMQQPDSTERVGEWETNH